MKKAVFISLFIFWSIITAVLTAAILHSNKVEPVLTSRPASILPDLGQSEPAELQQADNPQITEAVAVEIESRDIYLDAVYVKAHNKKSDCWIIVNNKVYDISSYFGTHPGGDSIMSPYCGGEGTEAFKTKDQDKPNNHSGFAYSFLEKYYINDMGAVIGKTSAVEAPSVSAVIARKETASAEAQPVPAGKTEVVLENIPQTFPVAKEKSTVPENKESEPAPMQSVSSQFAGVAKNTIERYLPDAVILEAATNEAGQSEAGFSYHGREYEAKFNAQGNFVSLEYK